MIFEEALKALREGKKITHKYLGEDIYLAGCYVGFPGEDLEEQKKRGKSIVKMKGDIQADEMIGKLCYIAKIKRQLKNILDEEDYKKYHNMYTEMDIGMIFDNDIFNYPQLNLFLVMSDEWEIME